MKYVDAFAGIGGFSIALKNVISNGQCVCAIEWDKNSAKTYKDNHGIYCLGDITKIDLNTIPKHDFLFGGFPCQAFSQCGVWGRTKGRTIDELQDERGNLFLYLVKILELHKPKYFLFENVKGIYSVKNKDGTSYFDVVKETLESTGYSVFTEMLDSADFGSAQQRKRVFFVGFRDKTESFLFPKTIKRSVVVQDIAENIVSEKLLLTNIWKNRKCNILGGSRLDELTRLYNSGYWTIPQKPIFSIEPVAIITKDTPSGISRQHDRMYSHLGLAPTLHTFSPPAFDFESGWRILSPRECARLQNFPESFQIHPNQNISYKQFGNSVNINVVTSIIERMLK